MVSFSLLAVVSGLRSGSSRIVAAPARSMTPRPKALQRYVRQDPRCPEPWTENAASAAFVGSSVRACRCQRLQFVFLDPVGERMMRFLGLLVIVGCAAFRDTVDVQTPRCIGSSRRAP